ncbi:MAG: PilZ domain-containing protein [bacterium]
MSEDDSLANGNRKTDYRTPRSKDPILFLQNYLFSSHTPDEVLFKINEILFGEKAESTRKYDRAPISLPVIFEYNGGRQKCTSYTLSQMGMFVKCPHPPPVDSDIMMEIELPNQEDKLRLEARVVHSNDLEKARKDSSLSGMSVVFTNVSQKDRRRLQRLVKAWMRKTGKVGSK